MQPNVSLKHSRNISSHVSAQPIPDIQQRSGIVFLPQATLTLNQLRNCCFNPKLSSHSAIHSTFDYNKTQLYPPGTRLLVHDKTTNCRTWPPRDTYGWYIGPALENYWCVECYIPSEHSIRIADTLQFISTVITINKTSSEYFLRQSVKDILFLLADPNSTVPYLSFGYDTQNSVEYIATLLNRAIPAPNHIRTKITHIYPQPTPPFGNTSKIYQFLHPTLH